jgi:Diadenosine tetraphosphate (Ap4A) hydrolase and other HIT family hydrolases
MTDCPFCQMKDTIFENELAQAFYDAYPVSEGHMLITNLKDMCLHILR